jgi:long-chain fatty acid transport protein
MDLNAKNAHSRVVKTEFNKEAPNFWNRISRHALLFLCLLLPAGADAVGFRLPSQDAEAVARGNAFVATADTPSAIYYNPAGITQIKSQAAEAGLYVVNVGVKYDSPTGAHVENKSAFQPVPEIYYVHSLKDSKLSYGVGLYVPYGLSIKYPDDNPFRTLAIEGSLQYITLNPVVAWQILPTLSIGGGPTFNYSEVYFKRGIGFTKGDYFKFRGNDFDMGFNAGIHWQPLETLSFGAKYHYLTTENYGGHSEAKPYSGSVPTSAEIRFPQFVVVGVSYRPTPDWNFEVNVDWTDWDNLDQIVFKGTAGGNQVFPLNWKSSYMYEFGVTRYLPNNWYVSAGYFFSENSIPDRNYNPIVPDGDLHLPSLGFGHKGERWNWAVAYHFAINKTRTVENSQTTSLVGQTADGSYRFLNQALTASLTMKF